MVSFVVCTDGPVQRYVEPGSELVAATVESRLRQVIVSDVADTVGGVLSMVTMTWSVEEQPVVPR